MTDHSDNSNTDKQPDSSQQPVHETKFDPETDTVSEKLVEAIAIINDADPTELSVLANVVDPDALDTLFRPRSDGTKCEAKRQIDFQYHDYPVRVQSDGTITLFEPDASSEREHEEGPTDLSKNNWPSAPSK
jgi:hypothetical protein